MQIIVFIIFIVLGAIFHEYSHAWVADKLGDPTARHMGRLTINPIVHIDPFGSILLPLIMWFSSLVTGFPIIFAYAKPVPYNPFNLKDLRWGPAWVGIAGPVSNILIAIILGIFVRFFSLPDSLNTILGVGILANVLLAVFNMVPIPPLDGSKLLFALLPESTFRFKEILEKNGFIILLLFIFFGIRFIQPIIGLVFFYIAGQETVISTINFLGT